MNKTTNHSFGKIFILSLLALIFFIPLPLHAAGKTLVILPFRLYADASKSYLRQGVTSILVSRLSGRDLRVISDEAQAPLLGEEEKTGIADKERAEELARTIDDMFPQPPAPVDRRGRAMPHLQEPREVVVRADPQTNSIIVDAPIQRMAGFEQLVEQLDRTKLTEETEVRTYKVRYAELSALSSTTALSCRSGGLE